MPRKTNKETFTNTQITLTFAWQSIVKSYVTKLMTYKTFFSSLFLVCAMASYSQNSAQKDNSIEAQFVEVIDKSNTYQKYKVIKRTKLSGLRKNILDTIEALEKSIQQKKTTIASQNSDISSLQVDLNTTQNNLAASLEREGTISLFGITTKKGTYNFLLFSVIGFLLLGLLFFIIKFKNSNLITKQTKQKLAEIEQEFDTHRQKKLEEQQVLRRKLQDEINKNK